MKSIFRIFAIVSSLVMIFACNKEVVDTNVALTTTEVTEVSENSAISGGNITHDGGEAIRTRGVCWDTTNNPTIAKNKTEDGKGTGEFVSTLTGLEPGMTYYVRAYATNANGTFYGNEVTFSTGKAMPTVTTTTLSEVTFESAKTGGTIVATGGDEVTACGVVCGENQNPTLADNSTVEELAEGEFTFTSVITGLEPDKEYYIRAYATNSVGTAYGNEIKFSTTTEPCVEFEDANLLAYLLSEYDLNNDGKLQESEALAITEVNCANLGITSLKGIENLPNLVTLLATDNPSLTSVDVSANQQLAYLQLIRTGVTSLDVEGMTSLQILWADGSPLTSLNVSGCTGLKELYVQQTPMSNLDVSGLTSLEILSAFEWSHDSETASIVMDGCTALHDCYINNSKLTSVSMENCPSMRIFRAWANNITSLSFVGMPELFEINADANKELANLEVSSAENPKLEYINIHGNKLTSLDLSGMKGLKYVHAGDNTIETMNFTGCDNLLEAYLFNNPNLKSLDFTTCPNLSIMWAFLGRNLESVDVTGCSKLTYIACDQSNLKEITLVDMPNLTDIVMWGNHQMTKAVCKNLPSCKKVNFEACDPLVDVTFENMPAVEWFNIIVTSVKSLDFSNMTKLNWLAIRDIPTLESVNLTNTPSLINLYGWNTKLTSIDLRGCSKNMNQVWLDANASLQVIYLDADQVIADLHKDPSCEIQY